MSGTRISAEKPSKRSFCGAAARSFVCLWLAAAGAGCTGSSSLFLVPWQSRWVEPGREPIITLRGCSAAWCRNEAGGPRIVIRKSWPMGLANVLVIVDLDKMPAGRGKQYNLGRGKLRAFWNSKWGSAYFESYAGTIAVERQGHAVLKIAMRCWVKQWNRALMGGWSGPTRLMLAGSGWVRWDDRTVQNVSARFEKLTGTAPATQGGPNSERQGK